MSGKKVAVVTGAIKGIGLAIARSFARRGLICVLSYYDWAESIDEMKREMDAAGGDYLPVPVDLTDPSGARVLVDAAMDRYGRLDVLVANIERGGWPVVHGPYTDEQWRIEWDTTVTAKWRLFRESLSHMKREGGGTVVVVSSIAGLVGRSGPAGRVFPDCYSLANRAIGSLTETWAREGAPEVRVNELMLGFVETRHGPGTRGWGLLSPKDQGSILSHTLLGRTGRLDEVARAVDFLVFDAHFMTGSVLRMDGGYVLGGDPAVPVLRGVVRGEEPSHGGELAPGLRQGTRG